MALVPVLGTNLGCGMGRSRGEGVYNVWAVNQKEEMSGDDTNEDNHVDVIDIKKKSTKSNKDKSIVDRINNDDDYDYIDSCTFVSHSCVPNAHLEACLLKKPSSHKHIFRYVYPITCMILNIHISIYYSDNKIDLYMHIYLHYSGNMIESLNGNYGLRVNLIALRDIKTHDPIQCSVIEHFNQDLETREKQLQIKYLKMCDCTRCIFERRPECYLHINVDKEEYIQNGDNDSDQNDITGQELIDKLDTCELKALGDQCMQEGRISFAISIYASIVLRLEKSTHIYVNGANHNTVNHNTVETGYLVLLQTLGDAYHALGAALLDYKGSPPSPSSSSRYIYVCTYICYIYM